MFTYLNLLFNICLFKKGPQDIPHSPLLLRLSVMSYAIISFLLMHLSDESYNVLLQVGTDLIIIISFTLLILSITHKRKRFVQTACALFGADAFISILAIPAMATLSIDGSNVLAALTMLILIIWSWLVVTHIIRHAIDKSFFFATGLVALYLVSSFLIRVTLFPA